MSFDIKYYPDKKEVLRMIDNDDPLLMLVSYDQKEILLSGIDTSYEHIILLKQLGYPEMDIDRFFRVVVSKSGADWTFVCPQNYKEIENRDRRIEVFYNDGHDILSKALKFIGYSVKIDIPTRYRRHINSLKDPD